MVHSLNKGKRFEREIAKLLTKNGFKARRGQQFCGGEDSPDVIAETREKWHIECKHNEAFISRTMAGAFEQVERDKGDGKYGIIFFKQNRGETYITLKASDFFKILCEETNFQWRHSHTSDQEKKPICLKVCGKDKGENVRSQD